MKRKIFITAGVIAFIGVFLTYAFDHITPKEIENAPEWIPLEEARLSAEENERLILVDIYEVGCKFCRAMEREVYPSPSVRAVLDRDFIPVKINGNSENTITFKGEQMTEKEFASQMGVTAFPFTVILDANGEVVDRKRGYMDVVSLSRFLRNASETTSRS